MVILIVGWVIMNIKIHSSEHNKNTIANNNEKRTTTTLVKYVICIRAKK